MHLHERIRDNMRMRELAVPVQALMAVLTCISLMWMVYTMAFFDPNPPTAAEVHSLETQDPEMQVFKTAAAMTVDALLFGPTQILLPVTGPSLTATPMGTITRTLLSTLVSLPTSTGTATFRPVLTPTDRENEDPNLPPATSTPRPTFTATDVPTTIMPPPTATATEQPPTAVPSATAEPTEPPATESPTEPPTEEPTVPPPTDDPTATESAL
jgi:hypothetical protein